MSMSDTYEQIVRELVEVDPVSTQYPWRCSLCGRVAQQIRMSNSEYKILFEDRHHERDCLWLRAKQAVEGDSNSTDWVELRRFDDAGNEEVLRIRKGQRTLDEVRES
jgi:hypothetical protein